MKIAFITLGCKLNYAETSTYERGFIEAGLEVVPWRQKADIYLINTCSVTETANAKSRSEIRKVHRINPQAAIVVVGCYAALRPDEIAAIDGVVRVFGNDEKAAVVPETLKIVSAEELPLKGMSTPGHGQGEGPVGDKLLRSNDAGNDGRGRSETKSSGAL